MEVKKIVFPRHGDDRGQLVALEEDNNYFFHTKRFYYMYDTGRGVRRGGHSHKKLEQILICIHGSCMIHLDNGKETEEILLNKPYEGLYIGINMWREMYDFSSDAVLIVLASEKYDESDYIRDYKVFKESVKQ